MRTREYMLSIQDRLNRIGKPLGLAFLRDRHAPNTFTAFIMDGWLPVSFDVQEIELVPEDRDLDLLVQYRCSDIIHDALECLHGKSVEYKAQGE